MRAHSLVRGLIVPASFAVIASCGGDSPTDTKPPEQKPPEEAKATTLTVSPDSVVVTEAGDTARFAATVKDQNGNIMTGVTVAWSSSDTSVARIDASGLVTGAKPGVASISATVDSLAVQKRAVVQEQPRAVHISISLDSVVVGTWGDTARLSATVEDQNGEAMSGLSVVWGSSDTTVAHVDASGRVTSRRAGRATITAALDSLAGESQAVVKLQMNAQCRVPTGMPVRGAVGGLPTFQRAPQDAFQVRSPRYGVNEIAQGDFDGDGDEDLLVLSYNFPPAEPGGEVLFWRNVGGRFVDATAEVLGDTPVEADNPRQIEIADLNGDGVLDVLAAQHGYDADPWNGAPDLVFLSQPGGKIREVSATNMSPNAVNSYTHASAAGDIDCDGDVDLFTGSGGGGNIVQAHRLYINNSAGSFVSEDWRMPEWIKPPDWRFTAAVMCDLDRDGDPELYIGGNENNEEVLLVNDGFGRFRPAPAWVRFPHRYGARGHTVDARCADLNLDGWMDLVLANANEEYGTDQARGAFDIWLNRGDLRFEDVTATWAPGNEVTQDWIFRAVPVDFNADGWLDIYAKGRHDKQTLYINRGGTGFTTVAGPDKHLDWVDADGDGRMDLFWSGATGPNGEQWLPYLYFTR